MATVGEFIEENKNVITVLKKTGHIPMTVLRSFQIYIYFNGLTCKSKMDKYQQTAEIMGVSIWTVMDCIKDMNKSI